MIPRNERVSRVAPRHRSDGACMRLKSPPPNRDHAVAPTHRRVNTQQQLTYTAIDGEEHQTANNTRGQQTMPGTAKANQQNVEGHIGTSTIRHKIKTEQPAIANIPKKSKKQQTHRRRQKHNNQGLVSKEQGTALSFKPQLNISQCKRYSITA